MSKISRYIDTPSGRIKVVQFLGRFGVVGGILVTAILLTATFVS